MMERQYDEEDNEGINELFWDGDLLPPSKTTRDRYSSGDSGVCGCWQ